MSAVPISKAPEERNVEMQWDYFAPTELPHKMSVNFYKHAAPTELTHGLLPAKINPVFSSNPNIKFMFCTA